MQNFTFGRKGTNWFLFAFVMLIGTLPSFGQDCATVTDENSGEPGNQQTFCYLSTVEDIDRTGPDTAIFETADTANDTQPIDSGELLTDGTTYYVGSTTEDCDRVAVEISVTSADTPDNSLFPGQNNFTLSPCLSSNFTADDLEALFTVDAGNNYSIVVYTSEFGTEIAVGTEELVPGESYYVAQVSSVAGECPSTRAAVGYNPTEAPTPVAEPTQTFCEGATVADLVAAGTEDNTQAIRWYRSATSSSPLADDVELIDGENYFASQIVNDRNDPFPPCETEAAARAEVTVEVINFDAGDDSLGNEICQADLDARIDDPNETPQDILLSFKDDIDFVYESVSFSPTPQSIYNSYLGDPYQTFTTTATFVTAEGCQDDVVIEFEVLESYDAGVDNIEGNEVCRADFSTSATNQEVEDYLISLLSVEFDDVNGSFSDDDISTIVTALNTGNGAGTFNSTYTAGTGQNCADSADLQFTVLESPNLEALLEPVPDLCNADIPALVNQIPEDVEALFLENFGDNIPEGGEFEEGDIQSVINEYNQENIGTFTVTYTVTLENGCSDSIELSRTVVEGEDANAGTFDDVTYCSNEDLVDLTALPNNDSEATEGGIFSGTGVTNNMFDPSIGEGEYTITYTVNEDQFCVTGDDFTTFLITVDQAPLSTTIDREFCVSEAETLIADEAAAIAYLNDLVEEAGVEEIDLINGFDSEDTTEAESLIDYLENPSEDADIFTFTYNNASDNSCDDGVITINITINNIQDAYAGEITGGEVCEGDEPINLNDYLIGSGAMMGGTFTLDGEVVENDIFDPSTGINSYTFTYTVDDSVECVTPGTSDQEDFTIDVLEGRELGDPITDILCVADLESTYSIETIRRYFAGLLGSNYSSNGTFEPSLDDIRDEYNGSENKVGEYITTYSLGTGICEDSVLITVEVQGEGETNAGDDFSTTFCSNEEDQDLYTFLSEDANPNGEFEGFEDGIFSPSDLGAGIYEFDYVVNETTACVTGEDRATFSIEVFEAPSAGEDFAETICITEAQELIETPQAAIDWFNSIVDVDGVDQDGEFDPALTSLAADIFAYVSAPDSPSATFETTYTVSNENCEDSANISLTINNLEEADAGENVELTFCVSQGDFDLRDYLSDDANPNGYFEDFDGTINTSDLGEGEFTYTYVVDETVDCVTGEDSVEFTVTIIGDLNAGADKSTSICNANIEDGMFPNSTSVRDYYLNMLDEGVSRDGTFSPSIQELVNWYNNESEIGDFTTTYTISEGECSDSAVLTVTVYESIPAEIDPIDDVTLCSIDDDQDLFSFLPEGADSNGYFEGYEDGMFSPSTTGAGEFEVTYTLDETSPCVTGTASATFTITVLETITAGEDMTASFCATDGEQDLFNFLDTEASTEGEFTYNDEVLVDGMFDASAMGAGSYEVTYTVEPINECGVATSTLTVTVNEVPDAPAAPQLDAFCAIEMATGADLPMAEGQTWYADADLTTMVMDDDMLVDGPYYLTVTSENGCESDATEVVITVNDSDAPTISSTNLEFCDADNPTIADLTAEIIESGEITWYDSEDGTNALGTSSPLTSGTYYATLTGETGCESSQRLAVTVSVETCPILYPEAITPNGDGRNDTFIIENITNEYPNYSIEIFNRWGNVIYKGNASTPAWDGTSNQSGSFGDDVLPVGVYFYVIDFNDGSTEPKQGKVYLSR